MFAVSRVRLLVAHCPLTLPGFPFLEPLRTQLTDIAVTRESNNIPTKPWWLTVAMVNELALTVLPGATAATVNHVASAVPNTPSVVNGPAGQLYNLADIQMPHNVEPHALLRKRAAAAATSSQQQNFYNIVGGRFNAKLSPHIAQFVQKKRPMNSGGALYSNCWVSRTEMRFVNWHAKPNAVPLTMPPAASDQQNDEWFNAEDIEETIDFSEYFCDRRIFSVFSGRAFPTTFTLEWQQSLQSSIGVSLGTLKYDPTFRFGGTSVDIHNVTKGRSLPLPAAFSYSRWTDGDVEQFCVAAQTSNPNLVVERGNDIRVQLNSNRHRSGIDNNNKSHTGGNVAQQQTSGHNFSTSSDNSGYYRRQQQGYRQGERTSSNNRQQQRSTDHHRQVTWGLAPVPTFQNYPAQGRDEF